MLANKCKLRASRPKNVFCVFPRVFAGPSPDTRSMVWVMGCQAGRDSIGGVAGELRQRRSAGRPLVSRSVHQVNVECEIHSDHFAVAMVLGLKSFTVRQQCSRAAESSWHPLAKLVVISLRSPPFLCRR